MKASDYAWLHISAHKIIANKTVLLQIRLYLAYAALHFVVNKHFNLLQNVTNISKACYLCSTFLQLFVRFCIDSNLSVGFRSYTFVKKYIHFHKEDAEHLRELIIPPDWTRLTEVKQMENSYIWKI